MEMREEWERFYYVKCFSYNVKIVKNGEKLEMSICEIYASHSINDFTKFDLSCVF